MPNLTVGTLEKRPGAPFAALALVAVRPGAQDPSSAKIRTRHPERTHSFK